MVIDTVTIIIDTGNTEEEKMEKQEVFKRLCSYDPRSPDYQDLRVCGFEPEEIKEPRREDCYCDNCFRGKDELALEILRLMDQG